MAQELGLGLLGFGEFEVVLLDDFAEVGEFFGLLIEVVGEGEAGFLGFFGRDFGAFNAELIGEALVERFGGALQGFFTLVHRLVAIGHEGVFLGELGLELFAGGFDKGCGEGFGEFDFRAAFWATESRVGHESAPLRAL